MSVQGQPRHLSWINPYMLEMRNIMRLLGDSRTPAWLIGIDPVGEMNALGSVLRRRYIISICTFGDRDEVATTLISDTGSCSQTMKP